MEKVCIGACALGLTAACLLLVAPCALATFHLIKVREVYPGSALNPEAEYVELQMYASGQNHVKDHALRVYDSTGAVVGTTTFGADVPSGANQSTILLATPQAAAQFAVTADASLDSPGALSPAG
ncbi:MAG TPA: hypothetical protein VNB59_07520, partial [Solirubrobacterales bacterium]|nr:hypothetical protein [Solirubrobacterales bacterium]